MPASPTPSMSAESQETVSKNHDLFRECLSTTIIQPRSTRKSRGGGKHHHVSNLTDSQAQRDAGEMADFIEWLAEEIFDGLPQELRELEYRTWREDAPLQEKYSLPLTVDCLSDINLDPTIEETLQTYDLISAPSDLKSNLPSSIEAFLLPCLTDYITPLTTPPPATRLTKAHADHCEICGRWWIPLSYHHLIPRAMHDKAVKRGWHKKEDLQNVAWLCGACHKFVHQFKGHEELAREYFTVERLMEEEDVRKWAGWVGKLRWKGK